MSDTKWTKGEWLVRKWNGDQWPDRRISVGPQSDHLAQAVCISPRFADEKQMMHDAHIIAAAPDLYEAFASIENDDGSIPPAIWEMRNAALAKARGES